MSATLSKYDPIHIGHLNYAAHTYLMLHVHKMLTPFSNYNVDDYGNNLLLIQNHKDVVK